MVIEGHQESKARVTLKIQALHSLEATVRRDL